MITGLVVLKMVLRPSRQRLVRRANSGPRWSMIGVSIARKMRSGSGEGPGMWRKCRPAVREEFLDIRHSLTKAAGLTAGASAGRTFPAAAALAAVLKDECGIQSSQFT